MATASQHRFLNGILIPQFLEAMGIEVDKETVSAVRTMFKKYLRVGSTSALSPRQMSKFCEAFIMLAAREWGLEIPLQDAETTMTELLNQTTEDYDLDN